MCDAGLISSTTGFGFCHPEISLTVFGVAIGSVLILGYLRGKFGGDD